MACCRCGNRCGSVDDGIWLTWYFLNTSVMNETFSVIFNLPSAPPCTTRSHISSKKHVVKEKFRNLPLFEIVDFAKNAHVS